MHYVFTHSRSPSDVRLSLDSQEKRSYSTDWSALFEATGSPLQAHLVSQ